MVDVRVTAQHVLDGAVDAVGLRQRRPRWELNAHDEEPVVAFGEEGRRQQRDRQQAEAEERHTDPDRELPVAECRDKEAPVAGV